MAALATVRGLAGGEGAAQPSPSVVAVASAFGVAMADVATATYTTVGAATVIGTTMANIMGIGTSIGTISPLFSQGTPTTTTITITRPTTTDANG
jgi:hypothetical protein